MTTPNRPPLWKVLHQVHLEEAEWVRYIIGSEPVLGEPDRFTRATEIRALRDWLVPEEPPPHRGMRPGGTNLTYQETLSVEHQRLRTLLTTEAERAEAEAEDENGSMALAAIADAHALSLPQGEVE